MSAIVLPSFIPRVNVFDIKLFLTTDGSFYLILNSIYKVWAL